MAEKSTQKDSGTCDQCKATGLPILPVRYAVVPNEVKPMLPAWASGERVKDVPLSADFAYALRTMREGYIYIFYSKNARGSNQWECYTVWPDGCLYKGDGTDLIIPPFADVFPCARKGHNPLAMHYLIIESPEKCLTTWIAFSDHRWSQETIDEYQKNKPLRNARMQEIEPAAMAKGTKQTHGAIAAVEMLEGVIEYAPSFDVSSLPHGKVTACLSEEDGSYNPSYLKKMSTRYPTNLRQGQADSTIKHMKQRAKDNAKPNLLALWDAMGIAHELNGFRSDVAGWIDKYGEERELQITALNAIDGAKRVMERQVRNGAYKYADPEIEGIRWRASNQYGKNGRDSLYLPLKDLDGRYTSGQIGEAAYKAERSNIFRQRSTNPAAMEAIYADIDARRAKQETVVANNVSENWKKYEGRLNPETLGPFRDKWNKLLTDADSIVDRRTVVLVNWLEAKLFVDSLEDFHPTNIEDGVMFEDAIGEATFGMGSSKSGREKIDAWIKEAKASIKSNLLWRAIALNQQQGIEEIDAALQTALSTITLNTPSAWNVAMANLKNLQRLADTYKKAQGVLTGNERANTKGTVAFGVRIKPINTRGIDRIVITFGDQIFRAFRINRVGDFLSEKLIQHIFSIRAFVDPVDSLRLVATQAKKQNLANADVLRRIQTAKAFLDMEVPSSQQAGSLGEAWDKFKASQDAPANLKDARLALIVMLIESGNCAKLIAESDGSDKTKAMIAASAMSMAAAVLDIASVPAKSLWANESATFQKLKLFGGLLGGLASFVGAGVDFDSSVNEYRKGHMGLVVLYGMKSFAGGVGGLLTGGTAFTYGAGIILRLTGRTALAQSARVAGGTAARIIAARILLMSVGAWITVITIGLQLIIWAAEDKDNALQIWCDQCAFGKKRDKGWSPKRQMELFDQSVKEVI